MRKFLIGFIAGMLFMVPVTAFGASKIEAILYPDIKVLVDGNPIQLENTPIVVDGRTYLPLRELGEKVMGMNVSWDQDSQTASLTSRIEEPEQITSLTDEQLRRQESFRKSLATRRAEFFEYDADLGIDEVKDLLRRIDIEVRMENEFLAAAEKANDPERFPPYLNEIVVEGLEQLIQAREYWQAILEEHQQPAE